MSDSNPNVSPRPTSSRVELVTDPSEPAASILAAGLTRDGKPLNIFSTMAHHPWLLKKFLSLGDQFLNRGLVPDREREIVILRVGWNCQSKYEFGQHTVIGGNVGLTDVEISGLAGRKHPWSDADQLLVDLADELCEDDCVSDATYAQLSERWDEAQLVELVLVAGYYRMVSGFLNTFGVELDAGVPGFPE